MDMEKLIVFMKAFGFPAAIAIWFLWKIQAYMDASIAQQATIIEILRQLVAMH